MRSHFILLPLAAFVVFAPVGDADARAGKGFRSLFGSSNSSSDKGASSAGDKASYNPSRGGEDRTGSTSSYRGGEDRSRSTSSSYRGGDYRFQLSGSPKYRPQPASSSPPPTRVVAAPATAALPVIASLAPAAAPVAAAAAAKTVGEEARVRADSKKYRDPNAVDVCPPPAFVFDELNGCRPKGAQISNLR